jgi:tetratricopeptide (TPR) repeat protein
MARAAYYNHVSGDTERAIDAYERVIELSPDNTGAHNNVALLYSEAADYQRAARSTERAVGTRPSGVSLLNLHLQRVSAGDTTGARLALEERRRLFPENQANSQYAAWMDYHVRDDRQAVRDTLDALLVRADPLFEPQVLTDLAVLAMMEGRRHQASLLLERYAAHAAHQDNLTMASLVTMQTAWADLLVAGRPDLAVARVRTALEDYQARDVPVVERNWLMAAQLLGAAGEPGEARALLDRWRREMPEGLRRRFAREEALTDATIALADGRVAEGLELHRRATERWAGEWLSVPLLALAYDMADRPDDALATYRRYETMTHYMKPIADCLFRALAYERMAQLHEERGDIPEAAHYYQRFIELWKDADPELQPRVDAARRAMARLAAEGRGERYDGRSR